MRLQCETAAVEDSNHIDVRLRGDCLAEAVQVDWPVDLGKGLSFPSDDLSMALVEKEDESGFTIVIPESLIVVKVQHVVAVIEDGDLIEAPLLKGSPSD